MKILIVLCAVMVGGLYLNNTNLERKPTKHMFAYGKIFQINDFQYISGILEDIENRKDILAKKGKRMFQKYVFKHPEVFYQLSLKPPQH
jgi:hypothetical protein